MRSRDEIVLCTPSRVPDDATPLGVEPAGDLSLVDEPSDSGWANTEPWWHVAVGRRFGAVTIDTAWWELSAPDTYDTDPWVS